MARTQTFVDSEVGLSIRNKLNSIADWNSTYTYNQYDVTHFNGNVYFSSVDNNIGNEPDISIGEWTSVASLTTGSTYPITSSWSNLSSFAPVIFSNVQIVNGNLLILSTDTNTWYSLGVSDNGSGSFTTNLTPTTNTGSIFASGSVYVITSSLQITSSMSASWASQSLSSSYTLTASLATGLVIPSGSATSSIQIYDKGWNRMVSVSIISGSFVIY